MFFTEVNQIKTSIFLACISLLSSCATVPSTDRGLSMPTKADAKQMSADANDQNLNQNLPNLDLDPVLLEQLLITNFASYSGRWSLAANNAMAAAEASRDPRVARLAALLALRAKKYTDAIAGAELWIDLQSNNVDAKTTLLLAQLGGGEVDAAYRGFEQRQLKRPLEGHIKEVAGLLIRQSNVESAIAVAERYLLAHPDSAQVALSAAYVADRFEREELAEQWLQKALELSPDSDVAAQMRISILRRQGKTEERATYIEKFVSDHPSSVGMRINHAAELARKEKFPAALATMQAVLEDDGKNVTALIYSAALAQQLDQVELAKEYYQQALALDPDNDDIHWELARFAVREQEYQRAERYYQQIDDEPNYFRAQLQVANMRYYTQGLKAAIKTLRLLKPDTESEYVDRATTRHYLLLQDHQYEEAFGAINETLAYLPENVELVYARALVAAELNELQTVETDLRSIIAKHPDHANALNALGYTLADQTERFVEAKELIVKALQLRPNDAHILDSMGWVLYRLSDFDKSVGYLQRAYTQAPEGEVAAHLGEVLWEKGEPDKARQVWLDAFDKETDNPLLNRTLERYGISLEAP